MRAIAAIAPLIIFSLITIPPLLLQTKAYPLAIVEGNSMDPVLSHGDLVIYHGVSQDEEIKNGTIISYLSSKTGILALDYMIKPVIIHRVVGQVVQAEGVVYYRTKGDNNQFNDSALVRYDQILGSPIANVPRVGAIVLFMKSPQGLIFAVAALTFTYLNKYDRTLAEAKKKKEILALFARMTLNGELTQDSFEKFKLTLEFADDLPPDSLKNPSAIAFSDWLRSGGLSGSWKEELTNCPKCSKAATVIRGGKGTYFLLCPRHDN